MKHRRLRSFCLRVCPFVLSIIAVTAFGGPQLRMHEALDALRRAKTSAQPAEDLRTASRALSHGRRNKAGYRVEAIPIIERAIAELSAGDRIAADKSINAAITRSRRGSEPECVEP